MLINRKSLCIYFLVFYNVVQDDYCCVTIFLVHLNLDNDRFFFVKVKNNADPVEMGKKIIENHLYGSNKEKLSSESINKLPAGAIVQITKEIMTISGMEKVDELQDF